MEAAALGLQIHQMAGFDPPRAAAAVNLPEGWDAVTLMALGYSEEIPTAPAPAAPSRPPSSTAASASRYR